jgi:hypothetical protein
MKGDFSRITFDPMKNFKGVRMQQGRVQLDADWNENLDILLHRIETETMDVIGLCGFPIHAAGFGVVADPTLLSAEEQQALQDAGYLPLEDGDFLLTAGRGYVDGILCEIENTVPYTHQPFILPPPEEPIIGGGTYVVYLDVWERLITALEDPSIREVALGGPDTAVRSQVVWQVKFAQAGDVGDNLDCDSVIKDWPPAASDGLLCARTHPEPEPDDPCTIPPGAGYKRLENQLYRLEIHKGSDDPDGPTFKWSRDNGSVLVKIAEFSVDGAADKVRVTSLGRDDVLGLHELDWVEVTDDAHELAGEPGLLVQIDKIDRERLIVTLKDDVTGFDLDLHAKLRRWDSDGELTVEVPAGNDGYIPLEDGVEVKFEINTFHTGDYWTIAARTVPGQYGDIEWPREGGEPACLLPFGISHHYCKLAIVTVEAEKITEVLDCRDKFPPLTELPSGGESCCSVTVGEGGDYADIKEAIEARPPDADFWNICLLSGEHKLQEPVTVDGQDGIGFVGCSDQVLVSGAAGQPLLKISNSSRVRLEGLMLQASAPEGAVLAFNCVDLSVKGCKGENTASASGSAGSGAGGPILVAIQCKDLSVQGNAFRGSPAVVVQGMTVLVSDNFFTGGGVQVLFGSQIVAIEENLILKGVGAGIQLAGLRSFGKETGFKKKADIKGADYESAKARATGYQSLEAVRETKLVSVKHNLIGGMDGSGIVTLTDLADLEQLGEVSNLVIDHNEIIACGTKPDVAASSTRRAGGGIVLASVSDVSIQGNLVAQNGGGRVPACGILVVNGANVEISGNEVADNGSEEEESTAGYQTGIAALFVLGNDLTITDILGQNLKGLKAGVPALRVHGNQVSAPAGLAFNALAFGTVQVTGNNFVTRGRREQPALVQGANEVAACAQVFNFGHQAWLAGLAGGQAADIHYEVGDGANLQASKTVADGRIMFNDNQVTLVFPAAEGRDPRLVVAGVVLFSLDDVSFQSNQVQSDVTPDKLLVDAWALGATVRAAGNNFSEPAGSAFFSYASQGSLLNSTTGNQAVHCILTAAPQNIDVNNQVMLAALCKQFGQVQAIGYQQYQAVNAGD